MNKIAITLSLLTLMLTACSSDKEKEEVTEPVIVAEEVEEGPEVEDTPEPEPEVKEEPEPEHVTPEKRPMPEMSEADTEFYNVVLQAIDNEVYTAAPEAVVDVIIDKDTLNGNYILTIRTLSVNDVYQDSPYYLVEHIQSVYPDMLFVTHYTEYNLSQGEFDSYVKEFGPNVYEEEVMKRGATRYYLPIEFTFD